MNAVARNGSEYQMRGAACRSPTGSVTDSAKLGGTSSVATVSSEAPIAIRSQRPRCGSCIRMPRITNTIVGITKMRNGAFQPHQYANRPPNAAPMNEPVGTASAEPVHVGARLDRVVVGDQRVVGG